MRLIGHFYILTALLFGLSTTQTYAEGPTARKAKGKSPLEDLKLVEGDETGNEVKALKTEIMVSNAENKAIKQAEALIRKHRGSSIEADLHFRLGELYMRKAKTDRFFEIHRQSETVVRLAPRLVQKASSRATVEKAILSYEAIQKKFPRFAQIDLVIFNNAFARQGLGQDKNAEQLYWDLIRKYPNSPLVADAHLAIGEINFDRANFAFALDHFRAIRKFPDSRVYPYGLYKSAWSLYNMHQPEEGLKVLEEVVDYGRYVAKHNIQSRLDLRKEALSDMTLFYEDVYPSKQAFAYFQKQAGELDVGPIMLKLARIYDRHSRYRDMQTVLDDFIRHLPESPSVASIHNELAWNYDNQKLRDKAVDQMEKLAEICHADSKWLAVQKPPVGTSPAAHREDLLKTCTGMLNETTLKLAAKWLKIWKKSPQMGAEYADSAERAFSVFLKRNSSGKEASEARYAYAELLFQREKFRDASREYSLVSRGSVTAELSHDASYAALLSLEKAVKDKWNDDDEKNFSSLAGSYIKQNPTGKFRLDIEFKLAMIAYEKNRFNEAAPIFMRLGSEFPGTEKGVKSQDLYMDILNLNKDYKGLREFSAILRKKEKDDSRLARLGEIHEQAYFLEIQKLEQDKDYKAAIKAYQDFIKANSGSALVEKALWNAMNLQFKVGEAFAGAVAAEEFYDRFPSSKESVNALLKAAQTYESTAQLERAAQVLLKLAKIEPQNQTKWQLLAADFFLLSGRWVQAKKFYTDISKVADSKTRFHCLEKLSWIEKNHGSPVDQLEITRQIASSGMEPQASLARVQFVEEKYKSGETSEAFNEAKRLVGSAGSKEAQARARLVQAQILEDEFTKQSVKARAEKVGIVLAIKTEKLEKAQAAYQSAMRYGDPKVTVQSLRRLAGCYQHYVKSLREMPTPAGLSPQDAEAFREELNRLAIPLEEKGVESLAQALDAAKKFKLRDGSVSEISNDLRKVNMQAPSQGVLDVGLENGQPLVPTTSEVGS